MVTDHFPKVSETFFVDKFLGLRRRGWDVHVVSQRSNKEHWEFFPTLRDEIGDSDERLHVARDNIDEKLAELEPDIVHFGYGVLAAGRMHLQGRARLPRNRQLPGLRPEQLPPRRPLGLRRRLALGRHAPPGQRETSGARPNCAAARRTGRTRSSTTPSTSASSRRRSGSSRRSAPLERPLRLLSVGRLHWKKGHEYALEAVKLLTGKGLAIDYRIVGEGEQRESTEFAIRDFGIARERAAARCAPGRRSARALCLGRCPRAPLAHRGVRSRRRRGTGDGASGRLLGCGRPRRERRRRCHGLRRAAPRVGRARKGDRAARAGPRAA